MLRQAEIGTKKIEITKSPYDKSVYRVKIGPFPETKGQREKHCSSKLHGVNVGMNI